MGSCLTIEKFLIVKIIVSFEPFSSADVFFFFIFSKSNFFPEFRLIVSRINSLLLRALFCAGRFRIMTQKNSNFGAIICSLASIRLNVSFIPLVPAPEASLNDNGLRRAPLTNFLFTCSPTFGLQISSTYYDLYRHFLSPTQTYNTGISFKKNLFFFFLSFLITCNYLRQ